MTDHGDEGSAAALEIQGPVDFLSALAEELPVGDGLHVELTERTEVERTQEGIEILLAALTIAGNIKDFVDVASWIKSGIQRWRQKRRRQPSTRQIELYILRSDNTEVYWSASGDITDKEVDAFVDLLR